MGLFVELVHGIVLPADKDDLILSLQGEVGTGTANLDAESSTGGLSDVFDGVIESLGAQGTTITYTARATNGDVLSGSYSNAEPSSGTATVTKPDGTILLSETGPVAGDRKIGEANPSS